MTGLGNRGLIEDLALFFALLLIYGVYLQNLLGGRTEFEVTLWGFLVVVAISGAPFFVVAWRDPEWRAQHAIPVAIFAWIVVYLAFKARYGETCPAILMLLFVPLAIGARVASGLGSLFHDYRHH